MVINYVLHTLYGIVLADPDATAVNTHFLCCPDSDCAVHHLAAHVGVVAVAIFPIGKDSVKSHILHCLVGPASITAVVTIGIGTLDDLLFRSQLHLLALGVVFVVRAVYH